MLEFLKAILGDSYTEDIDKKMSEEIGKTFVSKADFNAAKEAKKTAEAQLVDANKTIDGFKELDFEGVKKAAEEYKEKAEQAEMAAAAKIADMQFNTAITSAIGTAKGRNAKAVMAMLDIDALKTSKNQETDIKAAIEATKKEHDYMFESDVPPPYAAGTGTQGKPTSDVALRAAMGLPIEK